MLGDEEKFQRRIGDPWDINKSKTTRAVLSGSKCRRFPSSKGSEY